MVRVHADTGSWLVMMVAMLEGFEQIVSALVVERSRPFSINLKMSSLRDHACIAVGHGSWPSPEPGWQRGAALCHQLGNLRPSKARPVSGLRIT
ncbi:hypothetical protein MES5069_220149 [Mesorhizobium escarrei]|uniref:Uncharacterized protein n=1 Tax=Mesorhizobium escarrei TaxID=666018 RepID=A0ABN8JTR3_9HYPH|nr:hypothetical protein MES5069_220149 [Mesorhizobium escarrei]